MSALQSFLQKQNAVPKNPKLEDALVGGNFSRYMIYRLKRFVASHVFIYFLHLLEFYWLAELYSQMGLIKLLMSRNLLLLVSAFWWGALEIQRTRIRKLTADRKMAEAAREFSKWVNLSLVISLFTFLLSSAWLYWTYITNYYHVLRVVDFVLYSMIFRLVIDLPLRTYYSGIYSLKRVYRPIYLIFAFEFLGLLLIPVFFKLFFLWAFPLTFLISSILSSIAFFYYARRALDSIRMPKLQIGFFKSRPSFSRVEFLVSGMAYVSLKLANLLVVFVFVLNPQAGYVLYLLTPMISGASDWSGTFYFDMKKMDHSLLSLFKNRFAYLQQISSFGVGALFWFISLIGYRIFTGALPHPLVVLALFIFFVSRSWYSIWQVHRFSILSLKPVILSGLFLIAIVYGGGRLDLSMTLFLIVLSTAFLLIPFVAELGHPIRLKTPDPSDVISGTEWIQAIQAHEGLCVIVKIELTKRGFAGGTNLMQSQIQKIISSRYPSYVTHLNNSSLAIFMGNLGDDFQISEVKKNIITACAGFITSIRAGEINKNGKSGLHEALAIGMLPKAWEALPTSQRILHKRFKESFPGGVILETSNSSTHALNNAIPESKQILVAASQFATQNRHSGKIKDWSISAYFPNGVIRAIFLAPKSASAENLTTWRETIQAESFRATVHQSIG